MLYLCFTSEDDEWRPLTAIAPTAEVRQAHTIPTARMMLLAADMALSDVVIRIHRHNWNTPRTHYYYSQALSNTCRIMCCRRDKEIIFSSDSTWPERNVTCTLVHVVVSMCNDVWLNQKNLFLCCSFCITNQIICSRSRLGKSLIQAR